MGSSVTIVTRQEENWDSIDGNDTLFLFATVFSKPTVRLTQHSQIILRAPSWGTIAGS